jgi:RNA recognition motif-containing protein
VWIDKKKAAELAEAQKQLKRAAAVGIVPDQAARPVKTARGAGLKSSNPAGAAVIPDEYLPPNKILFVQNLPDEYSDADALTSIFGRYEGFREVRLVPGRKGIAFIEYESESGAINAKGDTSGMTLGEGQVMKVTYQRQ